MKQPVIYLETTIFNFPYADDAPQYKADTLRLFAEIKSGKFKPITSDYVLDELNRTIDTEKRGKMNALVTDYSVSIFPGNDEINHLAKVYISSGVIPERYYTDALHIAAATVYGADFIVSLNYQHIVKHTTIIETELINAREGYKRVFIHTPAEVISHDENA